MLETIAIILIIEMKSLLIGEGADRYITGFGSDIVINPTSVTTVLEGLQDRVGDDVDIGAAWAGVEQHHQQRGVAAGVRAEHPARSPGA